MAALPPIRARCIVIGGGPAGLMTGFLLARAGVEVAVLEKHADFNRDFRGDTIHPSTLEVMHELGLLDELLQLPHQDVHELRGMINGHRVAIADFSHLPTRCKFVAFMPQWDFLNFLTAHAKRFPQFALHMQHKAVDLIYEGDRVSGVRLETPDGEREAHGDLIIAADGRHSMTHEHAGLELQDFKAPIDVLWMALSKSENAPANSLGFFRHGKLLVVLDRGSYLQIGFVIPKGGLDEIKQRGLEGLHRDILELGPFLADRIAELDDWSKIKLLTVQINRLRRWYRNGLLCIGDCAHAMSPAGGVGINLALQDAISTANLLAEKLKRGPVSGADLAQVQKRREWPAAVIQRVQVFVHHRMVTGRSSGSGEGKLAFPIQMLQWFPMLRRIPGRLIGMGLRPEHIHSRAA